MANISPSMVSIDKVTTECPRCNGDGQLVGDRTAVDWYETEPCPDCTGGQIAVPADVLRAVELTKEINQLEDQKANAYWRVRILQPLGEGVYGCSPSADMLNEASGLLLACRMAQLVPEAQLRCLEFQYPEWAGYIETEVLRQTNELSKIEAAGRALARARQNARTATPLQGERITRVVPEGERLNDPFASNVSRELIDGVVVVTVSGAVK